MPFYQRSFLYLIRKRTKSLLLLLIFLLVNSMILSTNMILHATERTAAAMQEKTKAKVISEITDTANEITDKEAEKIENLANVISVNRMGQQSAYLTDLTPVTASDSAEPDNQKVCLQSFDDMKADSPFEDQSYRLTDGQLIGTDNRYCAVVNAGFAEANGLQIGDKISLEAEEGKTVTVEIIGEYLAGNENRQEKSTLAVYRVENQIYIDNTAYLELFGDGFYKVSAYTGQPDLLGSLAGEIQEILQDKVEVTTSDALYQQMKAPLTQITRVVELMRMLTFITGTVIVSLLLCMWMRSRQKEMAVFLSMGEQKFTIFLQALLEAAVLFLIAIAGACGFGWLAAEGLQSMLFTSMTQDISLQVSLQFADIVLLLGIGSVVVVIAVMVSLVPVIRANPKDILSRMEG
ncbi:MAG TPA: ABC transporter permease [Candidatus Mediterraneibacter surreyensis]|nr:ABC transporter permease [Candidatus Mediterraneibacter surreyensis]